MPERFGALRRLPQEQWMLLALVSGAFLPFYITIPILLVSFGLVLAKANYRQALFAPKYAKALPLFCGFTVLVAVCFQNWFGLLACVGFYVILSLGQFIRHYICQKARGYVLRLVCLLGGACGGAALLDWVLRVLIFKMPAAMYRCQLWFFNPNYLATMLTAGVLVCLYLLFVGQVSKKHALPCLVLQLLGVYFTGSAFAWVAMVTGVCMLLLLVRRVRLMYILLLFIGAGLALCALVPLVMSRWHEMDDTLRFRLDIWAAAVEDIRRHFLVGRGFFGYFQLALQNPALYQTTHAHNLVLDSLLNYGLVGCVLGSAFFIPYFKEAFGRWQKGDSYCGFLLAGLVAVLAHSVVDMTMLWVQTGLLFAVLMGCIGATEDEAAYE